MMLLRNCIQNIAVDATSEYSRFADQYEQYKEGYVQQTMAGPGQQNYEQIRIDEFFESKKLSRFSKSYF